jgi:hypothetical protein
MQRHWRQLHQGEDHVMGSWEGCEGQRILACQHWKLLRGQPGRLHSKKCIGRGWIILTRAHGVDMAKMELAIPVGAWGGFSTIFRSKYEGRPRSGSGRVGRLEFVLNSAQAGGRVSNILWNRQGLIQKQHTHPEAT